MKREDLRKAVLALLGSILLAFCATPAVSQSQASDGQIEGTVTDENSAGVPSAIITATNKDNGVTRIVTTDESGLYRFSILTLGSYTVTAEAPNFKKVFRDGLTLTTGQSLTVDFILPRGSLHEVVTVSGDSSIADAGKTDLGRVMNTREVQNLPSLQRNPYSFGQLHVNVNGRPGRLGAFANYNVNGYLRRINYLLDGNTNTQGDQPSIRFMFISETYVSEIQLVTNGFAPEFGNTPGLIMNVVTANGTNDLHGTAAYAFRLPSFYTRPFFYRGSELPDNRSNILTATIGGPILRDRWHYYFGVDIQNKDDKATSQRLITIRESDKARLIAAGLPASIFPAAIPSVARGKFFIARTDAQLSESTHLAIRFNHSDSESDNFTLGGLNTLERTSNASSTDYSIAAQLAFFTPQILNEFRFQYGQRGESRPCLSEFSGTGPTITITGVANFGSPICPPGVSPPLRITQFQDNLTYIRGTHAFKVGGGLNFYDCTDRISLYSSYTFATIDDYLNTRAGTILRQGNYSHYDEVFGDPQITYKTAYWNFFVQDDWKLTRRLKINYGMRYDLYTPPAANPNSPFPYSQRFNRDTNNFAPRIGVVYALRNGRLPTVLRFGAGIYFDQPALKMYSRALQNNGDLRIVRVGFQRDDPRAPAFPNSFSSTLQPSAGLPAQDIDTVSPDFVNMYAIHANVQLEQALTSDLSVAVGFVHSSGRHLSVYSNINPINPDRFLSDGRGVFSSIVSAATRRDPRFNVILMPDSSGTSRYDALNLQLTQRLSHGIQFAVGYTLAKATDNAPEQNAITQTIQGLVLSDPNNRRLDQGNSFADQRHTFFMSAVAHPSFHASNPSLNYLLNHNQIGLIATANSGERFNIVSTTDVNNDGVFGTGITNADRPVGITRNSGKTPPQYNVDLRYSRFFVFTERYRLEVYGEFQNVFNIKSIVQYNNVSVITDPVTGEMIGPLPDFAARNQSTAQESRQFQAGLKFYF
ncbi:MAG: hypothetical protein DMF63_11080 [Acidobacteria bacterium]|nr:MAG: hypothetical protein DMF63_11080 [Acidobacteriota bacterium]